MKSIPGYRNYYATEDGVIIKKVDGVERILATRIFKNHPYKVVDLIDNDGNYMTRNVHSLVLYAYHGPKPDGLEARHLDGDSLNNHKDNLKWGTRAENVEDKRNHGTTTTGERNGRSVLKSDDAAVIRSMKGKINQKILAEKYNVSIATISRIQLGKNWKEIV